MPVSNKCVTRFLMPALALVITRLMVLAEVSVLSPTPMMAETNYCAFEVKVTRPSGKPVAKVPVYLMRDQRIIANAATDEIGIARICDAPLTTLNIGVGSDVCGSVLIRAVKATWPEVQRIFVTYNQVPCHHFTFEDRCQVLLRIQDQEGTAIVGARFDGKPSAPSGLDMSDSYGRLFRHVKEGERLEGIVRKEGYEAGHVSEQCLQQGEHDIELKVLMQKR
jgi:hypothetical protein